MEQAQRQDAIPYDVEHVELGHVDGRCSFDSIMLKYHLLGDPALVEMAKVVMLLTSLTTSTLRPMDAG
jgi:hypothetical protein